MQMMTSPHVLKTSVTKTNNITFISRLLSPDERMTGSNVPPGFEPFAE